MLKNGIFYLFTFFSEQIEEPKGSNSYISLWNSHNKTWNAKYPLFQIQMVVRERRGLDLFFYNTKSHGIVIRSPLRQEISKKKKKDSEHVWSKSICLYHESFSLANKKLEFFPYPRVLQFALSLIEEIRVVVYYIYPLIVTPFNDICILLSFPVGRSINPIWGRNELFPFIYHFFFLGFKTLTSLGAWSRWSLPSFFSVRFGSWSWARSYWPKASSWSPCLWETKL